jgi:hypothetical protein
MIAAVHGNSRHQGTPFQIDLLSPGDAVGSKLLGLHCMQSTSAPPECISVKAVSPPLRRAGFFRQPIIQTAGNAGIGRNQIQLRNTAGKLKSPLQHPVIPYGVYVLAGQFLGLEGIFDAAQ